MTRSNYRKHARVNVFEGARRIALLLAALVTVCTILIATQYSPYVVANFDVTGPQRPPSRTDEECDGASRSKLISTEASTGESISATLCFRVMSFPSADGGPPNLLVPYKLDSDGMMWGNTPYSAVVEAYVESTALNFRLSREDEVWLRNEERRLTLENWKDVGIGLLIGLGIYWALILAIGWIVRGFMGIPMGQDKRVRADGE